MLTWRTAALKTDLQAGAETFANEAAARIWAGPPLGPQNLRHRFRVLVCLCQCFFFISGLLFCCTPPSPALLLLDSFLDGTGGAFCIGDYGGFKSRPVPLADFVPPCQLAFCIPNQHSTFCVAFWCLIFWKKSGRGNKCLHAFDDLSEAGLHLDPSPLAAHAAAVLQVFLLHVTPC